MVGGRGHRANIPDGHVAVVAAAASDHQPLWDGVVPADGVHWTVREFLPVVETDLIDRGI